MRLEGLTTSVEKDFVWVFGIIYFPNVGFWTSNRTIILVLHCSAVKSNLLFLLQLCYITIGFFIYGYFTINSELTRLVKIKDKHACFDKINAARENFITLLAVLFFFTAIKLLKYMNFNHSMFQMQMTLSKVISRFA